MRSEDVGSGSLFVTIERAAAEPEHGTGQPDACDPEAFLAPLFGRCVHISQNVAGD